MQQEHSSGLLVIYLVFHPRENLFFDVCTCRCKVNWRLVIMYNIINYHAINDFLRLSKSAILLSCEFCSFPANNFNISMYTWPRFAYGRVPLVFSPSWSRFLSCVIIKWLLKRIHGSWYNIGNWFTHFTWGGRSFSSASFSCFTTLQIVFFLGLEFHPRLQHPWIWFMSCLIPFGFRELNFCKISSQEFAFFLNVLSS